MFADAFEVTEFGGIEMGLFQPSVVDYIIYLVNDWEDMWAYLRRVAMCCGSGTSTTQALTVEFWLIH